MVASKFFWFSLLLGLLVGCDGSTDGASELGKAGDRDGDGWADSEDCDDSNPVVYPGAYDPPYDGIDEDCGGEDDYDLDGDGFVPYEFEGLGTVGVDGSGELPTGDCWDDPRETPDSYQVVSPAWTDKYGEPLDWPTLEASDVNPSSADTWYDGVDQDCGDDDDFDKDLDGYRSDVYPDQDGLYGDDCFDDLESAGDWPETIQAEQVHPGGDEVPGDGVDENCDGIETCLLDQDDDGFLVIGASTVESKDADCDDEFEGSWSDASTDCDDTDPAAWPGAEELPGDEVDQDCDGLELCFVDRDADGYRVEGGETVASKDMDCQDPPEALASDPEGDCDDSSAARRPGATEITGDSVDQDCDGAETCYLDSDGDGYRPNSTSTVASSDSDCSDAREALSTEPVGDCDDSAATTWPGAPEIIGDEIDQDCDSVETCYRDYDLDGYRPDYPYERASTDLDCDDAREAKASDPAGDCLDSDATIHPGATEVVGDEIDQNCDGAETCYLDYDDDGYRPDSTSTRASTDTDCDDTREAASTEPATDCDDARATVYPGAAEYCNTRDDDCDGTTDESSAVDAARWYRDADSDTYGWAATYQAGCTAPSGYVGNDDDCNDSDGAIHPGVTSDTTTRLLIDDDCDNYIDEDSIVYGSLVITEIQKNSTAGSDPVGSRNPDANWIEIYNTTANSISLSNWAIAACETEGFETADTPRWDDSCTITEFAVDPDAHVVIASHDRVVLCQDSSVFSDPSLCDYDYGLSTWTGTSPDRLPYYHAAAAFNQLNGILGISLDGTTVDQVGWYYASSTDAWPNLRKRSMALYTGFENPIQNDDKDHWCTDDLTVWARTPETNYGSPGSENDCE